MEFSMITSDCGQDMPVSHSLTCTPWLSWKRGTPHKNDYNLRRIELDKVGKWCVKRSVQCLCCAPGMFGRLIWWCLASSEHLHNIWFAYNLCYTLMCDKKGNTHDQCACPIILHSHHHHHTITITKICSNLTLVWVFSSCLHTLVLGTNSMW